MRLANVDASAARCSGLIFTLGSDACTCAAMALATSLASAGPYPVRNPAAMNPADMSAAARTMMPDSGNQTMPPSGPGLPRLAKCAMAAAGMVMQSAWISARSGWPVTAMVTPAAATAASPAAGPQPSPAKQHRHRRQKHDDNRQQRRRRRARRQKRRHKTCGGANGD